MGKNESVIIVEICRGEEGLLMATESLCLMFGIWIGRLLQSFPF